jgi:transposase
MSLKPDPIQPVPEETARIAHAAFRRGNPLLSLRDELGAIFADADFADLFPRLGQPGLPPWRLALVTLLQFRENLPDRQAAEAVRARIDWKYLLGLELTDPGFDHSVLCEFRARLLEGGAEERLLHKLLEACQARGLLKARGRQRTDATYVLAAIRVLNRLELLGETLRAALNELATVAPDWLRAVAPEGWYKRYARRIEDGRLPHAGSRTAACRAPRPSATPTRGRSVRTGSRCSTGSTRPRHPRACAGCRRWRSCGRSGPVISCGRAGRLRAAACGSGPRATRRRRRSRSSPRTTRRRATAPARASAGPATSST